MVNFKRYRHSLAAILPYLGIIVVAAVLASPTIRSAAIDDLDSAHHIMDGIFFRDAMIDHPLARPISYTLQYYEQYPALGFLFWPPFFPVIEGIAFLFTGIAVQISRVCVLGFGFMLGMVFYTVIRRRYGSLAGFLGALLLLSTPLVALYLNQVMLEVPVIAMGLLTVAAYYKLVAREGIWLREAILFAVIAAAAAYTKQTIVFVYAAIACDVLVNHRRLLRQRRFYIAAILLLVLLLPLAIYTLMFGRSNLEVSFGSDKAYMVSVYSFRALDRWTVAAWILYPTILPSLLNPVVVLLGLGGLVYACFNRPFLRSNCIWIAWIVVWYLLFSYFLNRQTRYAVLWVPGWIALAVAFLWQIGERLHRKVWVLVPISVAVVVMNCLDALAHSPPVYWGMNAIIEPLIRSDGGNIAYFGTYRQLFVPLIRQLDTTRSIYTLQGDDIVNAAGNLGDAAYQYRVKYLVIERARPDAGELDAIARQVHDDPRFTRIGTGTLHKPVGLLPIETYRYSGPVASKMARVPLESKLLSNRAVQALNGSRR